MMKKVEERGLGGGIRLLYGIEYREYDQAGRGHG